MLAMLGVADGRLRPGQRGERSVAFRSIGSGELSALGVVAVAGQVEIRWGPAHGLPVKRSRRAARGGKTNRAEPETKVDCERASLPRFFRYQFEFSLCLIPGRLLPHSSRLHSRRSHASR